jgi:hypothetical protein
LASVDRLTLAVLDIEAGDPLASHVDLQIDDCLAARVADDRASGERLQTSPHLHVGVVRIARAVAKVCDAFDVQGGRPAGAGGTR